MLNSDLLPRNPATCVAQVAEFLSGSSTSNLPSPEATVVQLLKETYFTRAQSLGLLCYLQLALVQCPSLRIKVEACCDSMGYTLEDSLACEQWARSVSPKIAKLSICGLFSETPIALVQSITAWVAGRLRVHTSSIKRLSGISGEDFRCAEEKGILNRLFREIPSWDVEAAASGMSAGIATVQMNELQMNSIRVSDKTIPRLAYCWKQVCMAFDLESPMDLYVSNSVSHATLTGVYSPVVVLPSQYVNLFDDQELAFILGREVGKVVSQSQSLLACIEYSKAATNATPIRFIAKFMATLAVDDWLRAVQLTCDRAGLLACQSSEVADRVFLKWMGFPLRFAQALSSSVLKEILTEHAVRFQDNGLSSATESSLAWFNKVKSQEMPFILRAMRLHQWIDSGEFAQILFGRRSMGASSELEELVSKRPHINQADEQLLSCTKWGPKRRAKR